jgi:mannose-6-phosphate isomerase-like protein (cupin superfamily)
MKESESSSMRNLRDVPLYVGPDGAHVRELAGLSSGMASHSLAHITHPAGTASAAHHHSVADEVYFVSAGHGQMRINATQIAIGPGDIVEIHPGQVHKVWCDGPEDLELIVTCAPAYTPAEVRWDE